jgi:HSP20 family molecular chaperone IbpA
MAKVQKKYSTYAYDTDGLELASQNLSFATSIYEKDNVIIVKVDLHDIPQTDLDVNLENNALHIAGHRESVRESKDYRYPITERSYTNFERIIPLPTIVNPDESFAELKNGILVAVLPEEPHAVEQKKGQRTSLFKSNSRFKG